MMVETDSNRIKFICSYNGKIATRPCDGLLRYFGGLTRILAADRSISYAQLMMKLVEFCGFFVDLKCQLPDGDFKTLITVKSDEELANLIDEYNQASRSSSTKAPSKIKAVLTPPKTLMKISPPPSFNFSCRRSDGSPVSVPCSYRICSLKMSYRARSAPRTPSTVDFSSPKSSGSPMSVHCSCRIHSPPTSCRTRPAARYYPNTFNRKEGPWVYYNNPRSNYRY